MPFQPGHSGNPGGRRKLTPGQKRALEKARKLSYRAMERMAEMLEHEDPRVVMAAAKLVCEYGLGKPTQAIDVTQHTDPMEPQTAEERAALAKRFRDAATELERDRAEVH